MKKELKHILCVDDEADILEVTKMCLEVVGEYKVTTLSSGAEAIKQVSDIKPDLILLDVMMPQMDGPATLAELRKKPELNDIPVIFMTARIQKKEVDEYYSHGASGVISKPFEPMELAGQIQQIWEKIHDR